MIAVDTSAVFAIAAQEAERERFIEILDAEKAVISAVTYVESVMVLTGRSRQLASGRVNDFMSAFGIEIVAVDRALAEVAVQAFDRFGKGRNAAALNLSDCFSYALARTRDVPLLFKGDDFAATDIVPAWRP